jgi:hypothetical protein
MKRIKIGTLMLWIIIVALAITLVAQARRAAIREFGLRTKMELLTFRYAKELKAKQAELDKAILDNTK